MPSGPGDTSGSAATRTPRAGASRLGRVLGLSLGGLFAGAVAYLALAPVPISPVAWEAPANPGYTGVFAADSSLTAMTLVATGEDVGPEAIARDAQGRLYLSAATGWILRLDSATATPQRWVQTGGRPLGLAFDTAGTLWVADARRGLLRISPAGEVQVAATEADGRPIRYADDVDVATDGRVYVSDASTKFFWPEHDALEASILEVMEHRGTGRLLEFDPATGVARELAGGLVFANGVAVTHDQRGVLVNEMGQYRVLHIERDGPGRGAVTAVVTDLPGFPDNLTRGRDGRYWLALVSPRSGIADALAGRPALRRVLARLPKALRPGPKDYGHVVAFDSTWRIVADLQDPTGKLPALTHALEADGRLWLGSLRAAAVGWLPLP